MTGLLTVLPTWQRPELLMAIGPWLLLVWLLYRWHRGAFRWLEQHVSPRFLARYTAYGSTVAIKRHGWLVASLGILLAVAAAGPSFDAEVEAKGDGGDVLLLLDASQSMDASDVAVPAGVIGENGENESSRFEVAVELARELVAGLPNHRFALSTWSGSVAPELPMTKDGVLLDEALHHVELHTIYQSSGSSFAQALDAILPYTGKGRALQAIFLSDGEQPFAEDYEESLRAVIEAGVGVHAFAIGTEAGQGRTYTKVSEEEKPFKTDFHTRRVDEHLSAMARRSGGQFSVVESYPANIAVSEIRQAVRTFEARPGRLDEELAQATRSGTDQGRYLMIPFLVLFLLHTLWIGRRGRRGDGDSPGFDLSRLGTASSRPPAGISARSSAAPDASHDVESRGVQPHGVASIVGALLLMGLVACAPSLLELAHRANERGLALDETSMGLARPHFERSRAYGVEAHIPSFNLARGLAQDGELAEAHELFEQTMQLEPDLVEAPFADGILLFDWGEEERDPRGCELDRTMELWQASLGRFEALAERPDEHAYRSAAVDNAVIVRQALTEIEKLIEEPPEACRQPPPPQQDDSQGQGSPPPPSQDDSQDQGAPPPPPQQDDSQDQNPPPPPPSSPPPPGGQGQGQDQQPPPPSGGLSPQDELRIQQALHRIQGNTRRENVYHRRTPEQQWRPGVKVTERVWW